MDLSANTTLNVGTHQVSLRSFDRVHLRGTTTLGGGQLVIETFDNNPGTNGLQLGTGATISGSGVIVGNILPHSGSITATSMMSTSLDLDVAGKQARLLSTSPAQFIGPAGFPPSNPNDLTSITIAGGALAAPNGVFLTRNSELLGHGSVSGPIAGDGDEPLGLGLFIPNGAKIVVEGGGMTVGNGLSNGFDFEGNISVGSQTLTVLDSDQAEFGRRTTLAGGTIVALSGVNLSQGDTISGHGLINGPISGPGNLTPTGVFDMSSITPLTVSSGDDLTVLTTARVTLSSNASPDVVLNGGTLRSTGGFLLDDEVTTGTSLLGSVTGGFPFSNLFASADVTIGDPTRSDGVRLSSAGSGQVTLSAREHDMVLLDSDGVEAQQVFVSGGSIRSDSGFIAIAPNSRIAGWGLVFGELDPAFDLQPAFTLAGPIDGADVGDGRLTVLSDTFIRVENLSMNEAGRLVSTSGPGNGFLFAEPSESFAGTVAGSVAVRSDLTATGDLTMGAPTDPTGFQMLDSVLNVGNHRVTLLDQNEADVDQITLAGGEIVAANGLRAHSVATTPSISGFGVVRGQVNANLPVNATGPLTLTSPLNVGSDTVTLVSSDRPTISADIHITGGELISPLGLLGNNNPTLSGFAVIRTQGPIDGFTLAGTSPLPAFTSALDVGSDTVFLLSSQDVAFDGANVTMSGGKLTSSQSLTFLPNTALRGSGSVNAPIAATGVVQAIGNGLTLGDPNSSSGVLLVNGVQIEVGSIFEFTQSGVPLFVPIPSQLHLLDSDLAVIDGNTTLIDGSALQSSNGVVLTANNTLNVLGSPAGPGVPVADSSLITNDFGNAFIAGPFLNFGTVNGPSLASGDTITFLGAVDGDGSYSGAIRFNNAWNPGSGSGPGQINAEHITLAPTAQLTIEIGGLAAGSEYDQIIASGAVSLGGELAVELINGYALGINQQFDIFNIGGTGTNTFTGLFEGDLVGNFDGTDLFITYASGDGNDISLFTKGLAGDFDLDLDVDGFDFLMWQRGESPNPLSASDLAAWEANYGTIASLSASSVAVPEPATAIMLLSGVTAILVCRS